MTKIDDMLKNKLKHNINPINKILSNKPLNFGKQKGASISAQHQWKSFSIPHQTVNRILYKDTDRDGVPDKWDCQPKNPLKQDIRFGRKPRNMELEKWMEYQNSMNFITKKEPTEFQLMHPESKLNQVTKMNTVLEHDREIKKLQQTNSIFRDENWHKKYNDESRNALKLQDYEDNDIDQYLEIKHRKEQELANFFVKKMQEDGSWDKIFNNKKEIKRTPDMCKKCGEYDCECEGKYSNPENLMEDGDSGYNVGKKDIDDWDQYTGD